VRAINYVAPLVAQFLTWKFLRRFSPADFSVFPLQVPWVFSLVTFIVRLLLDMFNEKCSAQGERELKSRGVKVHGMI